MRVTPRPSHAAPSPLRTAGSAIRPAFGWVVILASLACGCRVYDPGLLERDAGPGDGTCEGRVPPARPDGDGPDVPELVFGLRDVILNQESGDAWRDIGFNLDGFCTRSPDYVTECQPVDAPRPMSDGNDGIDNVFGSDLFPLVEASVMAKSMRSLEETARAAQLAGVGLPVLRLRNWNGTPNDRSVNVTITQAVFSVPAESDGSEPEVEVVDFTPQRTDGTAFGAPAWDGTDYVWAREDTFLAGDVDQPLVFDDNAYVVDNQVVTRLPDRVELLFPADGVGVVVSLTGAVAVGRISEDRSRLDDVIVAGRWSRLDLLRTAEIVGVCMGTGQYNVLELRLAAIMDVRSRLGSGGPDVECDAVSLGVGFTGYRMRWGQLTPGRELSSGCGAMAP
jgi:hypothetical protein